MSALTDYVNDLIWQAYDNGVDQGSNEIKLLHPKEAEQFIADELDSGAWDDWLNEFLATAQNMALLPSLNVGAKVLIKGGWWNGHEGVIARNVEDGYGFMVKLDHRVGEVFIPAARLCLA